MASYTFQFLNGATTTGTGDVLTFVTPSQCQISLQVVYTGAPSVVHVHLEGTINGVDWDNVLDAQPGASGAIVAAVINPVTALRANLITLTGGTSPAVSVYAIVMVKMD